MHFIVCLISIILCGLRRRHVPSDSGCRNLVYKEEGLSRSEYLPCAREIVAALDELARLSDLASRGDEQARSDGRASCAARHALMKSAGGRNLLERWDDRALTDLNMKISNAVTHFDAFYMVRVRKSPTSLRRRHAKPLRSELRGRHPQDY